MRTIIDAADDGPMSEHEAEVYAAVLRDLAEPDMQIAGILHMASMLLPEHLYRRLIVERAR